VKVVDAAGHRAAAHGVPSEYRWHAPASHIPFVPQVEAACTAQVPDGSGAPVATFEHRPIERASAHDLHAPEHAVAQQTPCAQTPETHSPPFEQKAPFTFLPHDPVASQVLGATQSPSSPHVVKQRAPLHANGAHGSEAGLTQVPAPSHVAAGVKTFCAQRSAWHVVPALYLRHAPAPSQVPSAPQDAAPWSLQTERGSAAPAGTAAQWPIDEASAQLLQAPVHASAQQTPSTQKPLAHSVAAAQVWPRGLGPQLPATQAWPGSQSSSVAHFERQAFVPQR
jgi:hypothetical protein